MNIKTDFKQIGIVGGGKMGTSLFNHLCKFNFGLVWYMRSNTEDAQSKHQRKLNRALKNNLIDASKFEWQKKNQIISSNFNDLKDCFLIIECVSEDISIKRQVIRELFKTASNNSIIASNSSSIMPSLLSENAEEKIRLVGMHFFYPVEVKTIVELVISESTSDKIVNIAQDFASQINKTCLRQNLKNAFLLNRIMLKWQAFAFGYGQQQNISFNEIDAAVNRYLFPGGIFEMMDHIGLDTIFSSALRYSQFDEPTDYNVNLAEYLYDSIQMGELGVKTKQGFHAYPRENKPTPSDKQKQIAMHLANSYFSIYNWAIENKLCSENELLFAMNEYLDTNTSEWHNLK